ncbi:helix-turn-helix transcriptional regulator [Streptomyces sp. TRM66268-LWL]|uniref:Helix-turn-helix transcriptional regulator n=1 Tax=Streptomyces polyasparticus TaxID=2767826 RepID=A0ABR7SU16_9ACTN|nr:helix-turn-helix transcriptional regulator [Streptomyces polyasparticus]MBC9718442.1 helix-turn-helix transcriptional regulator [Streptomyces polyasparticus]
MPVFDGEHTGKRIAAFRKKAGLTQLGLADRIPYSHGLLRAVERGDRTASSGLIAAVAEALRVDPAVLKGQPYVSELAQDRLMGLIRPIREALDLYDLGDNPDVTVRTTGELTAAADSLCRKVRATKLHAVATELPTLLAEITAAAYRSPTTETWQALGSAYRTAHDVATKLGFPDLSTVALDRMGWAAERASDPLLGAARQYMRALSYFRNGECSVGLRLIEAGRSCLEQAEPGRNAFAVRGQMHLGSAVLYARARDKDAVATHLREARRLAKQTGEAGDVLWMSFGPTNVKLHRTSTLIEMRQYGEAVEQSRNLIFPAGWSASRVAHHHVHRSYALMETRRYDQALAEMIKARQIAPEQTRYYPPARETIRALVRQARRTPDTLDHMAAWIGM